MPKYKKVNEGVVDRFIGAIFTKVGKGLESATIRKISKADPELGKQFQDLQNAKKRLEISLDAKTKKQLANDEIPDIVKQALKGNFRG